MTMLQTCAGCHRHIGDCVCAKASSQQDRDRERFVMPKNRERQGTAYADEIKKLRDERNALKKRVCELETELFYAERKVREMRRPLVVRLREALIEKLGGPP